MASVQHWISAARPRTLPLALAGLALGNFIASSQDGFQWSIAVLSILTATFLQILSNYANDYGDFNNGADNEDRIGPARAVQSGAISAKAMKGAIVVLASLSLVSGILLLWFSRHNVSITYLLLMLALGILAIGAAYKYTASKNPYGYKGFGDIAVFLFFGLLAVMGVYYLQTGTLSWASLITGIAFGALSTGVLNLNNMRDIENDAAVGKITVAVRLGLNNARIYHYILVTIGGLFFVLFATISYHYSYQYLFLIPTALLITHCAKVHKRNSYEGFNPLLKELALSSALIAITAGLGFIL